jgi:transaldolase/glucose-6-phosphate isomerase
VERVWAEDASFWKEEDAHGRTIESALGWLTIADRMAPTLRGLEAFVAQTLGDTDRAVVLGMGGSSLAPLVFSESFPRRAGFPKLEILDSTHPAMVAAVGAEKIDRTIFIVSSKSGSTLEPNIFFDTFFERVRQVLGDRAGERFVVITDPGSALEKEAKARRVRRIFPGDPRIGGRYSALSNFGIVPAAFAGIDVGELLRRAAAMAKQCRSDLAENPGVQLGAALGGLAREGRNKTTFATGAPVGRFGMWIEQLIAESTGKEGTGILPVEGEALGAPAVYGPDRFFVEVTRPGDTSLFGAMRPLGQAGHPTASYEVSDALDLGAEMFRWEFATAIAGKVLGINPFDQPNVQEAKDRTNEILGGKAEKSGASTARASQSRIDSRQSTVDETALRTLLDSIKPGDYFAITAYIPSTEENEAKLNRIRLAVRDAKKVATTVGFGPRFLHSTGQLHKGGPPSGVFLQITDSPRSDVPIPGKPYTFGQVIAAQAAGDLAALKARGRRAMRVHLEDLSSGLNDLDAAVRRALSGLA